MLTPTGYSNLPTVTPTMAEDLTDAHLHQWHTEYRKDLTYVTMCAAMLGLCRTDEVIRLTDSTARLHAEITTRRDTTRVIAEANAILQGAL